jgi:hypothetical protein
MSNSRKFLVIVPVTMIVIVTVGTGVGVGIARLHASVTSVMEKLGKTFRYYPKVVVDQNNFELGVIDKPDEFSHDFVFHNAGDAPLELTRGPSTCSCTLTGLPDKPIPPGGQGIVSVGFNEMHKNDALKTGMLDRGVTVFTNDPDNEKIVLGLKATVRRVLAAEPPALTFSLQSSDLPAEDKRSAEALIYSQIWNQFDLAIVKTSLEGVKCRIEPVSEERLKSLKARGGYRVEVTLPLDMADGRFTEWIELSANPIDSSEKPRTLRLEINGKIEGRLAIFGSKIDSEQILHLGVLSEGDSVREKVLMKVNDQRRSLTVSQIEAEPEFMRVHVSPFQGESAKVGLYRIEVEIPHDAPSCNYMGTHTGVIKLKTDHPRLPVIELKVDFAVVRSEYPAGHIADR